MLNTLLPLIVLILTAGIIWWLGSGSFGRGQTQRWIDRLGTWPRLHAFLDYHHGKFRAAMHYVEFGGLFLVLYWLYDAWLGGGDFAFRWGPAGVIALLCAGAAYLDEVHQLRSGTREFRTVDFLHSCCGITIALAAVFWQAWWRGVF